VFDIRRRQKKKERLKELISHFSRPTAYRIVKSVMNQANIKGKQATGKGLRHGYGVNMVSGQKTLANPYFSPNYGPQQHKDNRNLFAICR